MTENIDPKAAAPWTTESIFPSSPSGKLSAFLIQLEISLDHHVAMKLSQALEWSDIDLANYKLIKNHPKLPEWWSARNNKLFVPLDHTEENIPSIGFHSGVPHPQNCVVFFGEKSDYSLLLWGSDSFVFIAPKCHCPSAYIAVGGGFVFLGPGVRSTARLNINCRNGGSVILSQDILIGSDVKLQTDDCHTIISSLTNKRINPYGGTIIVRKHVWLGEGALILGDTQISENCILGARSFLRGVLTPPGSILAGVPAKVTRSDVTWDSRDLPPDHPEFD